MGVTIGHEPQKPQNLQTTPAAFLLVGTPILNQVWRA